MRMGKEEMKIYKMKSIKKKKMIYDFSRDSKSTHMVISTPISCIDLSVK